MNQRVKLQNGNVVQRRQERAGGPLTEWLEILRRFREIIARTLHLLRHYQLVPLQVMPDTAVLCLGSQANWMFSSLKQLSGASSLSFPVMVDFATNIGRLEDNSSRIHPTTDVINRMLKAMDANSQTQTIPIVESRTNPAPSWSDALNFSSRQVVSLPATLGESILPSSLH